MPNLVGIGNSQVPTNAMLGGLAYQDSVGEIDIDKIKARTSDTAVDIFVYDTRKDSDGGAWRYRTQHLSWYNEGANEFRGARKEFPAVAVIVATSSNLIIYDGDDPNLSMWMEFKGSAGWMNGAMPADLSAKNGIMTVGSNTTNQRLRIVFFLKDYCEDWATVAGGGRRASIGNFLGRNSDSSAGYTIDSTIGIVDRTINDVAMTVLPNAPIDASTGLPIPTIAVATNAGFSVIKDDGTVIDKGVTSTSTNEVGWYKGRYLLGSGPEYWALWRDLPEESGAYLSSTADLYSAGNNTTWDKPQPTSQETKVIAVGDLIVAGSTTGYYNRQPGLSLKHPTSNLENGSSNLLCEIRKNYNTGWMHGDIKGAFLSDTDDTDLTNTNLVTNGDFSNGSTGWSLNGLTVNTSGNNMVFTSSSGNPRINQAITVEEGQTYYFSLTSSGNRAHYVSTNTVSSGSLTNQNNSFFTVPVGTTTVHVVLYVIGTGNSGTFDDVVVRKADPDRSINNKATNNNGKGLRVFGTITKTAVATGAELVAYSGFTSTNHLEQDDNHQFGTGDFSFIFWVKLTAAGNNNQTFIDMSSSDGGVGNPRMRIHQMSSPSGSVRLYTDTGNIVSTTNRIGKGWTCVAALRRSSNLELYINGKLEASGSTSTSNFNTAAGQLSIGLDGDGTDPLDNGSITLVRSSASAPSAGQIKKIYHDEKLLFQENAKCTLYGTSDAVTALAYDDSNTILHVGTSSGRSEFQGLKRINNTTTAVATAISVSNELVAEQ